MKNSTPLNNIKSNNRAIGYKAISLISLIALSTPIITTNFKQEASAAFRGISLKKNIPLPKPNPIPMPNVRGTGIGYNSSGRMLPSNPNKTLGPIVKGSLYQVDQSVLQIPKGNTKQKANAVMTSLNKGPSTNPIGSPRRDSTGSVGTFKFSYLEQDGGTSPGNPPGGPGNPPGGPGNPGNPPGGPGNPGNPPGGPGNPGNPPGGPGNPGNPPGGPGNPGNPPGGPGNPVNPPGGPGNPGNPPGGPKAPGNPGNPPGGPKGPVDPDGPGNPVNPPGGPKGPGNPVDPDGPDTRPLRPGSGGGIDPDDIDNDSLSGSIRQHRFSFSEDDYDDGVGTGINLNTLRPPSVTSTTSEAVVLSNFDKFKNKVKNNKLATAGIVAGSAAALALIIGLPIGLTQGNDKSGGKTTLPILPVPTGSKDSKKTTYSAKGNMFFDEKN